MGLVGGSMELQSSCISSPQGQKEMLGGGGCRGLALCKFRCPSELGSLMGEILKAQKIPSDGQYPDFQYLDGPKIGWVSYRMQWQEVLREEFHQRGHKPDLTWHMSFDDCGWHYQVTVVDRFELIQIVSYPDL